MSFLHLRMLLSAGTAYSSTATHIQSKFVVLAIVFGIGILRVRSAEIYFWIWISHRGRCNEKQGVVWLLGWTSLRSLWLPNVNPLLAQVGCRAVVCRSAGIGAKFLSGVYQATLQGTALPAGVGAGQTAFIPKSREVNASADHSWIFVVLERASVPQTLPDSATSVEHSCGARGQFSMMRVRVTVAQQVAICSRWLSTQFSDGSWEVLPPEPHRPWFLQRTACAYADNFALATTSMRENLSTVAGA